MGKGEDVKIPIDDIVKDLTAQMMPEKTSDDATYRLPRVPEQVREINKDAYTPKFVSIGPYHRGHEPSNPLRREELKKRYLWMLLKDVEEDSAKHRSLLNDCWSDLHGLENIARRFYEDNCSKFNSEEFVRMLLLDGCFIIKHLYNYAKGFDDPELYRTRWDPAQLRIDLGLLENQIPYFVLEALSERLMSQKLAESPIPAKQWLRLMAMWYCLPVLVSLDAKDVFWLQPSIPKTIHHLLHLVHLSHCAMITKKQEEETEQCCGLCDFQLCTVEWFCIQFMWLLIQPVKLLRSTFSGISYTHHADKGQNIASAVQLSRLAVNFEKAPKDRPGLLNVRFRDTRRGWLNMRFRSNGTLEIPPLRIERATAPLLHNLIALEQHYSPELAAETDDSSEAQDTTCCCPAWFRRSTLPPKPLKSQDYFSTYAFLMYNLVNTEEDIALLQKHGILQNTYGSDDQIISYFKNICLWSQRSEDTLLENVITKLRERTDNRKYRDWAELKKYCNSPTAVLLLTVSVIMFASTIVQTIATLRG